MKRFSIILAVAVLTILFTSCDSNLIYEDNLEVSDEGWEFEDIKSFEFDVEDTLSKVNIYVNLRTTVDYPYKNIYMYLYYDYPTGESDKDTLEFILAENDGRWLGENSGTIIEFKTLVASGGAFTKSGKYKFQLQHAMREDLLPEVVDVGMRFEKMEE